MFRTVVELYIELLITVHCIHTQYLHLYLTIKYCTALYCSSFNYIDCRLTARDRRPLNVLLLTADGANGEAGVNARAHVGVGDVRLRRFYRDWSER